ncbi:MAG: valine--tRNA ligase [Candidatus Buchananbacteria bacterium]
MTKNNKELAAVYEAAKFEDEIYKRWEQSGYFNPDELSGESFVIAMPPPNVTGILHLGHALENSLMDIEIRYQRMLGKKALLVPGTDHAAVATQARVEMELKKQGYKNPRQELGREGLLEKIREYAENSKSIILSQIKKMGTSCDWSRLAYTFDEPRSRAVNRLFKMMYDDGLIYRGYRVVNWSVKGQSTCSDDELVYVDQPTKIYTFKYSADFPIAIATTRPETKLGDTAVAVNPKDVRYQKFIGQKFTVDVGAAKPLVITIIADENVDPAYGTGAVGVTPAHSPIDYEMYIKNFEIGLIPVIGNDGKMTKEAGTAYMGLPVEEAREKFIAWLRENNLLIKEEETTHSVGTSDRFGDVVEALPMEQWFIEVNKIIPGRGKSLKELMREAVTVGHNGDPEKIIKITPERFKDSYLAWIDHLRPWCISRQIWWGHRIPVWTKGKEVFVGEAAPAGEGWQQDEDTLDTWFSSGAWTFSTLGWPEKTKDLKNFHPTSWMQMGYEILFFWMARMILMSTYALNDLPFKEVYIHGILRDKNGRKFSKSLGNGLDPLEIIKQYGTDALRLSLIKGITPGNDARFYEEKVAGARNFVNKLWNISRFILATVDSVQLIKNEPKPQTFADEWILAELQSLIAVVNQSLGMHEFSYASEKLYEFTWNELADWYLEIVKVEGNKNEILLYILQTILKLWHPFIPFVTEEIWKNLTPSAKAEDLLMIQTYPVATLAGEPQKNQKFNEQVIIFKGVISAIRNLRAENNIAPAQKVKVAIGAGLQQKLLVEQQEIIKVLGKIDSLEISAEAVKPEQAVTAVVGQIMIYVSLTGTVDVNAEKVKLSKEIANLKIYIIALENKLANPEFSQKAPDKVVNLEKEKLAQAQDKIIKLSEHLQSLK